MTGAASSAAAACTVRNNLEAMIDDSASMGSTDPHALRSAGLRMIMATPGNEAKTLGAIEFGDEAAAVFGPGPIGKNRTAFGGALDRQIRGDDFGTNYNAAFGLAKSHDPGADARLFLTDGGPNAGDYANGHRGGPPTYVVGLGFLLPDDEARLRQIAGETGGTYRNAREDTELQAAMNDVNAAINCQSAPVRVSDKFRKKGSKTHRLTVAKGVRSVQFALSWASAGDEFSIGHFRLKRAHRLKLKKRRGKTFVSLRVSGLSRGKLSYRVTANKVSSASTGVKLITQASRSKRK